MLYGFATDYFKRGLMGTYTVPATLYLAFGTGIPDPTGTESLGEVSISGTGYGRMAVTSSTTTSWSKKGSGQYANIGLLNCGLAPTASWGVVRSFAWYDAATSGNCIFAGALRNPMAVGPGALPPMIYPGQVLLGLTDRGWKCGGCISDWFADYIMADMMNGSDWSALPTYAALFTTGLEPGNQPGTFPEVTTINTNGYARQQVVIGTSTFELVPGQAAQSAAMLFGPPTAAWATAPAIAIVDSSSLAGYPSAHWLWNGRLRPPQTGIVGGGPIVLWPAGLQFGFGDER